MSNSFIIDNMEIVLKEVIEIPFPPVKESQFTFIDLFAGIGGFRIALQNLGGKCVFSSEIDPYSQKTYKENFGEMPLGDITKINSLDIPDHDILCGGFPCQTFSLAGKRLGFEDARGTLFFELARIIKDKQPKAFFLENVKGLVYNNKGKTLETILNILRNELGYFVPDPQIINAKDFGVPQNRPRLFIIGFRKDLGIKDFSYPEPMDKKVFFIDIREKRAVDIKYYLSKKYYQGLVNHKEKQKEKGNYFGYQIIYDYDIANSIVVGGMGKERNLVIDYRVNTDNDTKINNKGIRNMTPREWARLQGFPEQFKIIVSNRQAYKQFGNSVAIPAIQATAKNLLLSLFCKG